MKKIIKLGGGGDMGEEATRSLLHLMDDCEIVIADLDRHKADEVANRIGSSRVSAVQVDVHDGERLREIIRDSNLVINSTGPYYRTGRLVQEACIDERVDYIDFGDTDVAAKSLFAFEDRFHKAGITALTCCGSAPGLSSVLIRKCALQLDQVDGIDCAWVSGAPQPQEGKTKGVRALIEYMLFECTENTRTLRDGRWVEIPSFQSGRAIDFPEPLGLFKVFDCGHAEIETFSRFFPSLRNLRIYGSVYPPVLNAIFRGVGAQMMRGCFRRESSRGFHRSD